MPKDAFTRWLLTCRLAESPSFGEWLLPLNARRDGGLEHELMKLGASADDAKWVCEELGKASSQSVALIVKLANAEARGDKDVS